MNTLRVRRLMMSLLLIAFLTSAFLTVHAFSTAKMVKADGYCFKHIWHCNTCGFCKLEYWYYICDLPDCNHCHLYSHECFNHVECCAQ